MKDKKGGDDLGRHLSRNRLDEDVLGHLFAQGQAGVAHEANDIVVAGKQFHDAIFAETNFAQPGA